MERILIDFDTNGGNGGRVELVELIDIMHNKTPHREVVMEQVHMYLTI